MSYYAEKNGLAKYWERNSISQNLDYWARYHPDEIDLDPELFQALVNKLMEYDINLFDAPQPNIFVYLMDQLSQLSDEDIDNITGVKLNGIN